MPKTRRSSRSSTISSRFDAFRERLRKATPHAPLAASIACVLALGALAMWGLPHLRERAANGETSRNAALAVRFIDAPGWFDGLRQAEVAEQVSRAVGEGTLLDSTRLARAHAALETTGWFHSIEQVTLADDGGFIVEATFVRPFAIVRHSGFDYLVDTAGRILPMQWIAGHRPAAPHYPALVGSNQPAVGDYGTIWPGTDVAAGMELARTLAERPWFDQIAAIDVGGFEADQALVLITQSGGRVVWGLPPSMRTVGEIPSETKIETLDYLHARHQRIDAGAGRVLDLRGDLVTVQAAASRIAVGGAGDADGG